MKWFVNAVIIVTFACQTGCDTLDTTRQGESYASFGAAVYREGCQREAYLGQLDQQSAGTISTVDVSGALGRSVCVDGMPPPSDAPVKLTAIVKEQNPLIAVVDTILPKPFLDTLQGFLVAITVLADDGTMPTAITTLASLLGTMHDDPDFAPALQRLSERAGYRPTKTAAGIVHTIVEYPNIDAFLSKTLALIAPGGSAENEFKTLLDAASHELRTSLPVADPNASDRTLKLALDLMLSTHPDLGSGTPRPLVARDYRGVAVVPMVGGTVQAPFVDQDGDGLADVNTLGQYIDANGNILSVPSPFAQPGAPDSAPRDSLGQALTSDGSAPLYSFLNLDGTVIGGLARETQKIMDPSQDKMMGLVYGMSALLGPRQTQTKMYMDPAGGLMDTLTYNGFDTTQAPVLDLAHAFIQLLQDPNIDQTLQATQTLMNSNHESDTSRLVGAMLDVSDRGKNHPEAQVPATSDLYDDLVPILIRILRVPGLAEDLVNAMRDPRMQGFAPMVARQMDAKDQVDFDHSSGPAYNFNVHSLDNYTKVDRSLYDQDYNRSLLQRIAHLIHDANGTQFCNKDGASFSIIFTFGPYAKCDLFEIDDLALFYILNMASASARAANPSAEAGANFCDHITDGTVRTLSGDALIQNQTGINGFTCHPTPAALNRSLFLRQSEKSSFMQGTTDDVLCKDGDKFIDVHDKSIFAWEATLPNNPSGSGSDTFYDAVQPLVDAFARHDECVAYDSQQRCTQTQNAAKIFVDLFSMLHEHWTSPHGSYFGHTYQPDPTQPRFAMPDNVVSYEPLLVEVMRDADLMPALINSAPALATFTVDDSPFGQPALPILVDTARFLFDPQTAADYNITIAYRSGATSTVMSDGTTPVPQATPYYLIADAYAEKRAALNQAGAAGGAWRQATSGLVDQMLTVQQNADGTHQFQNRRFHAITLNVIDFLRSRIAAHVNAGDLSTWLGSELTNDLTEKLSGPVFAALGDFAAKVESDPDARTQLYGLLSYLMDEADNDLTFQTALTTLADQVQMFLDDPDLIPVGRVLGAAMDPNTNTVQSQLTLIKKAHDLDTQMALLTVLRNLYRPDANNVYPASTLSDVLSTLNRSSPGADGPLSADDYRSIFSEVQSFLTDEKYGFARFLAIVQTRNGGNPQ